MGRFHYHAPLDPECPVVAEFNSSFWDDPMTDACGCADEIAESWESGHRADCKQCQDYGAANIEVVD
jgi:hypothetical protein